MEWCVIKDGEVREGPTNWNPAYLSKACSACGVNVSLPAIEPVGGVFLATCSIVPVTRVPVLSSELERVDGETVNVGKSSVIITPIVRAKTAEELADESRVSDDTLKRMALENKYLEATKRLCQLAGDPVSDDVWPKLEDVEFEDKALIASDKYPAIVPLLLSTLNYTFFQLKALGWEWEQIEHRELPQ